MRIRTVGVAAALLAAALATASGQPSASDRIMARLNAGVQKLQQACGADLQKFCPNVTPGEGRLFYCALAHEDKLSGQCDYAIYKAMDNLARVLEGMDRVAHACAADIEKHCLVVEPGGGQILQCLSKNRAGLQPSCGGALKRMPAAG